MQACAIFRKYQNFAWSRSVRFALQRAANRPAKDWPRIRSHIISTSL